MDCQINYLFNMDEYYIQIIGKTPLDETLNDIKEYSIAFKRLACQGINKTPLEEGNYKITFKMKNLDEVTVISGDTFVRGKPKKGSQSQVLRNRIMQLWEQEYSGESDFETFYQKQMSKFIEEIDNKLI